MHESVTFSSRTHLLSELFVPRSNKSVMGLTSKFDKLKLRSSVEAEQVLNSVNNSGDTDDIDELDNDGQSILMGIISQLRKGSDLSRISLPTFILEKKSMLERITNFFQIPEILLEADDTEDDLERFILMVKFYLASWHIAPKAVKKPLNPVLGEIFSCYWDDLPDGSDAYYIAEQTSHHPPKLSYFYIIPDRKIRVDGTLIPKSRFLGNSSAAMMEGWAHVTLAKHDETYLMNQPNVYCRGILFGKLKYELGDHMIVKCPKTGYEADIEFKVKGMISGTYDAIDGKIYNLKTKEVLYTLSGKWNEVMYIKGNSGQESIFYDTKCAIAHKPKARPIEEQLPIESRKLWGPTLAALAKRDHDAATEEKTKVENEQRQAVKKREEDGVDFHSRLFRPVKDTEPEIEDLEFIIYKNLNLSDSPDVLRKHLFEMFPFLPGQHKTDALDIPAFEKHSTVKQ